METKIVERIQMRRGRGGRMVLGVGDVVERRLMRRSGGVRGGGGAFEK